MTKDARKGEALNEGLDDSINTRVKRVSDPISEI